jgi:hypothetical protein
MQVTNIPLYLHNASKTTNAFHMKQTILVTQKFKMKNIFFLIT